MLVYHQAYDSYHCIFRMLQILSWIGEKKLELDRIRIYDYYLLFPQELKNASLPKAYQKIKRTQPQSRYNKVFNPNQIYYHLESFQISALQTLASYNLIEKQQFQKNIILRSTMPIPNGLKGLIDKNINLEIHKLLIEYFETIPIKELKKRTKFIEYKYELSTNQ